MNMWAFESQNRVFVCCECVQGYAFDQNNTRAKSALLPVDCSDFAHLQDYSAHLQPMECLLPRHSRA